MCAAILAALRRREVGTDSSVTACGRSPGAACGVRFLSSEDAAHGMTPGHYENEVRDSGHHEEPGTVRGPERPQPVPGSTNGLAPSMGPKPKGLAAKMSRPGDVP